MQSSESDFASRRFSTASLPERQRLSFWRDFFGQEIVHCDIEVEREGQALVETWERYFGSLTQLKVSPDEGLAVLAALADWVIALQGDPKPSARQQCRSLVRNATPPSRSTFISSVCTQ